MPSKPSFNLAPTVASTEKVEKATTHFINLEFEVEEHIFNSPFGLSVANTTGEDAQKLLDRMADTGNTTALKVELHEITIGDDYFQSEEDTDLDDLLNAKPTSLLLDKKKQYESTLFWLSFKVTSDYFDGELTTGSVAFTGKANRTTLSKLLKVINSDDVDFDTRIRDVSRNAPKVVVLKKAIDF